MLWLWRRLAAAVLFQPLAWELPYDVGVALKKTKKKKKKKKEKKKKRKKKISRTRSYKLST